VPKKARVAAKIKNHDRINRRTQNVKGQFKEGLRDGGEGPHSCKTKNPENPKCQFIDGHSTTQKRGRSH